MGGDKNLLCKDIPNILNPVKEHMYMHLFQCIIIDINTAALYVKGTSSSQKHGNSYLECLLRPKHASLCIFVPFKRLMYQSKKVVEKLTGERIKPCRIVLFLLFIML